MSDALSSHAAAFCNEELELTPDTFGDASLFHTACGVHLVARSSLTLAVTKRGMKKAIGRFIQANRIENTQLDLAFGLAGNLIGCSLLIDAMAPAPDRRLLALGDELSASLWSAVGTSRSE